MMTKPLMLLNIKSRPTGLGITLRYKRMATQLIIHQETVDVNGTITFLKALSLEIIPDTRQRRFCILTGKRSETKVAGNAITIEPSKVL
eukprot:16125995-Heterocapsa_arctica.AAC.1